MAGRRIVRVQSSIPLGEVTVVPAALSGRAEAETVHAMAVAAAEHDVPTAADLLHRLRRALPIGSLAPAFAAQRGRGIG